MARRWLLSPLPSSAIPSRPTSYRLGTLPRYEAYWAVVLLDSLNDCVRFVVSLDSALFPHPRHTSKKKALCEKPVLFIRLTTTSNCDQYSYELSVLRFIGTRSYRFFTECSSNFFGLFHWRVVSPYSQYRSVFKKSQHAIYSVFKNKKTLWFLDQKSKNRKVYPLKKNALRPQK